MTSAADSAAPPVTVVVTRQVRSGRSAEFQRLMNGMRAADRVLAGFGEPEEADLALADERRHRADDVLDRHRRIHAMLV